MKETSSACPKQLVAKANPIPIGSFLMLNSRLETRLAIDAHGSTRGGERVTAGELARRKGIMLARGRDATSRIDRQLMIQCSPLRTSESQTLTNVCLVSQYSVHNLKGSTVNAVSIC